MLDYLFQGASAGCTYVFSKRAALTIQKSIGNNHSNFMKRPSHDWTFYAICRSNKFKWYYDSMALINYRQHENNFYGANRGLSGELQRFKKISNGWYKNQILFLEKLMTNSHDEKVVFQAIKRFSIIDRIWLIANSRCFRREIKGQIFLSFSFLFGLIK